jgi:acid stress chaperone HdeB
MKEECMIRSTIVAAGAATILLGFAVSQAQVSVDVSKITCEQFVLFKITDPKNIALWLSGYYNAKRGNTIIDPQALEKNTQALRNYCATNPETTVMQAVEKTLAEAK